MSHLSGQGRDDFVVRDRVRGRSLHRIAREGRDCNTLEGESNAFWETNREIRDEK
jgi:hypothetical protein